MLQFFRINDPYRLIFIFLILVLIRVGWIVYGLDLPTPLLQWMLIGERLSEGFTMYSELYDSTGPFAVWVYEVLAKLFGRSIWPHVALSSLLIIYQSAIFNAILLRNKAYDENNYLPAFFYTIAVASISDSWLLSPQLMSMTFILLALRYVFRRIDNIATDELFLFAGTLTGVAMLFYLPSAIFIIIFLLSFILFSSALTRRLLLFLYGVLTIVMVVYCFYLWKDSGQDFLWSFFVAGLVMPKQFWISWSEMYYSGMFLIGVGVISLSVFFTQRFTNFQQKMQQVMLLMILAAVAIAFLSRRLMPVDLLFLVPSVVFFLTYLVLDLRKRVVKAFLPYLVVMGLIAAPFVWDYFNGYAELYVSQIEQPEKRNMGVGATIESYQDAYLAGPFLDNYISARQLEKLQYVDGSSELYDIIQRSNPDVIQDEMNAAEKLFYRFPVLENQYRSIGNGYYQKISN